MTSVSRGRLLFAIVLAAAAAAWALPYRQPNCNTTSHLLLVESLADGTRTIDAAHGESCDISWWHGHYYANKAPGLALVTVPWYLAARRLGLLRRDPAQASSYPAAMRAVPRRDLWLMGLWGAVLPSLGLLVLVRRQAERLSPGSGTLAAAILAFATLLLPFAGLFFSHALSALVDFAAFSAACRRATPRSAAGAGLLAGVAIVVEYPNAILGIVLLAFVAATAADRLRSVTAYALGCLVGVLPLVAYDWWTFGSPFHLSYVGAVRRPGLSGHDLLGANTEGFFGVGLPTPSHLVHLLVGEKGLLMGAPILVLAPVGLTCLWRAGRRAETALIGAIVAAFLVYNAGYYSPLGGATPGPRFLVAILPLLAIAAATAIPLAPRLSAALVAVGAAVLLAGDSTQPLIGHGYTVLAWWHWVRAGSFTSTILDPTAHAWAPAAALLLATATGLAAGAASLRRSTAA